MKTVSATKASVILFGHTNTVHSRGVMRRHGVRPAFAKRSGGKLFELYSLAAVPALRTKIVRERRVA